jgi:hypothetical protein
MKTNTEINKDNQQKQQAVSGHVEPVVMLRCVGVDNKQHTCEPHKDTCYCGVKVKRKKLLKNDGLLFSCYECTY